MTWIFAAVTGSNHVLINRNNLQGASAPTKWLKGFSGVAYTKKKIIFRWGSRKNESLYAVWFNDNGSDTITNNQKQWIVFSKVWLLEMIDHTAGGVSLTWWPPRSFTKLVYKNSKKRHENHRCIDDKDHLKGLGIKTSRQATGEHWKPEILHFPPKTVGNMSAMQQTLEMGFGSFPWPNTAGGCAFSQQYTP